MTVVSLRPGETPIGTQRAGYPVLWRKRTYTRGCRCAYAGQDRSRAWLTNLTFEKIPYLVFST